MNKNSKVKENMPFIIIAIVGFACMFVYYYKAHPLYIYDMDDWSYLSYSRHAVPSMSLWNPTRILPETLMPLVATLGAWLVYPLTDDYIQSLCFVFAIVTALFIAFYFVATAKLIKDKSGVNGGQLLMIMLVFALAHFFIYLKSDAKNQHFFYAINVTCTFFYLISALWNFALCIYFMQAGNGLWYSKGNYLKKGGLLLAVYLAINSNMYTSIILIAYLGVELLYSLLGGGKTDVNPSISLEYIKEYIHENLPMLIIVVVWLISIILEALGGRAGSFSDVGFQLRAAIEAFVRSIGQIRMLYWIATVGINFMAVALALMTMRESGAGSEEAKDFLRDQSKRFLIMLVSIVYLTLLSAKVIPNYMTFAQVMIGWVVWLMLINAMSGVYILCKIPGLNWALPILTYILFFEVVIDYKVYANSQITHHDLTASKIKAVDNDIITQVKDADLNGEESVIVYVSAKESEGDWPLNRNYGGGAISRTLYYHGVTERKIEVTLVADESKDIEFNIK